MKIQTLNYLAFGPFTDKTLDFTREGLHIVFGPNEVGKSTALRGLKALLFGIETRTRDNFKHANTQLRISAKLVSADGQTLTFIRRKGRLNTLLDINQTALEPKILRPFLQGVTPEIFSALFGIDHSALVQGGQEILAQKGEVGQILFSAALGSQALRGALARLDVEAESLFKPQGSISSTNAALKSFSDLKKQIAEYSLSSNLWNEKQASLSEVGAKLETVSLTLERYREEIHRLRRIQRVAPKLSRRRKILDELSGLGEVFVLPDDFSVRRQNSLLSLQRAQASLNQTLPRKARHQEKLNELKIESYILEQGEYIESLHEQLGAYRQLKKNEPALKQKYTQLLKYINGLLDEVRPDLDLEDAAELHAVMNNRQSLLELGNQAAMLDSNLKQAHEASSRVESEYRFVQENLGQCPQNQNIEGLEGAVREAQKLGDIDRELQEAKNEFKIAAEQCDIAMAQLRLWNGDRLTLQSLALPNLESIAYFKHEFDSIDNQKQKLIDRQQENEDEMLELTQQLNQIQSAGDIPSEQALIESRLDRDKMWWLLRQKWLEQIDVSCEIQELGIEGKLHDVFEDRLEASDLISDRLRRESDRVSTASNLKISRHARQQKLADLEARQNELDQRKKQIDQEWQALWREADIHPRTPLEMNIWVTDVQNIREQLELLNRTEHRLIVKNKIRKKCIRHLKRQMSEVQIEGQFSKRLGPLLTQCEARIRSISQTNQRRAAIEEKLRDLAQRRQLSKDTQELAERALSNWRQRWTELLVNSGIQKEATAGQAAVFIDKVRDIQNKLAESEKLKTKLETIDQSILTFKRDVRKLTKNVDTAMTKLSTEEALMYLKTLLNENRINQTHREGHQKNIDDLENEIEDSRSTILIMSNQLKALRFEAKADDEKATDRAESVSRIYLELESKREDIERDILEHGDGLNLAELELEAKIVEMDKVPAKIESLAHEIKSIFEPEREELSRTKGGLEKELELLNGGDQAARLAEEAQSMLAVIRANSERYIRVKLAAKILRDEIERHRAENQRPLLQRAGEHFDTLTLGSFSGLTSDFNAQDEAILAGIRPNSEKVYVEGMSAGTRDQLYLALRLASLEEYFEQAEAMPFIVDDILVDFDDGRSQAALESLSTLARRTQVILFTHHAHLVEQAREISGVAQIHALA